MHLLSRDMKSGTAVGKITKICARLCGLFLLFSCAHWHRCTRTHVLDGILDSPHDVLIARAAADIAFQTCANLCLRRFRVVFEQLIRGHNHAWRAEATLETMLFPESFLDGMQAAFWCQPFDGQDFAAICLDSKDRARLDGFPIEHDDACSTLRCVATNMCSGEVEHLSQIVDEQHARFHF